jgi:hypothetical protein
LVLPSFDCDFSNAVVFVVLGKTQVVDSEGKIETGRGELLELDKAIGEIGFEVISPLKGFFVSLLDLFHQIIIDISGVDELGHEGVRLITVIL